MSNKEVAPLEGRQYRQEWEAEVVSVEDPKGLMRAQVRVYGLFDGAPDSKLPWATYMLPVGARANGGDFRPAHLGDVVWVDFPYVSHGLPDTRRPRITGAVHYCPDSQPNLPHEAWGGPDALQHKRTGNEPEPVECGYHESRVFTQHGITVEWERSGVYRLTHRKTGTSFELTDEGHSVLHSEKDAFYSSRGKTDHEIGSALTINVLKGDVMIHAHSGSIALKSAKDIVMEAGQNFIVRAKKFMETLG